MNISENYVTLTQLKKNEINNWDLYVENKETETMFDNESENNKSVMYLLKRIM